jgi:hypothetical protein
MAYLWQTDDLAFLWQTNDMIYLWWTNVVGAWEINVVHAREDGRTDDVA